MQLPPDRNSNTAWRNSEAPTAAIAFAPPNISTIAIMLETATMTSSSAPDAWDCVSVRASVGRAMRARATKLQNRVKIA